MDFGKCWHRRRRETIDLPTAFGRLLGVCLLGLFTAATIHAQPDGDPASAAADAPGVADAPDAPDAADEAAARARLEAFNTEVSSLTASFTQETWTVDDELVDEAAGSFALLRPGRFVWHTESPFEHLVVADGEALWMYDVELEQATRTGIDKLSGANPGSLLSGDGAIDDSYRIVSSYRLDDRELIELVPLDPRAEYRRIVVAFRGAAPVALEIVDGLNQTTSIEFSEIEINPAIEAARFEFDPPAGVDVIGDER